MIYRPTFLVSECQSTSPSKILERWHICFLNKVYLFKLLKYKEHFGGLETELQLIKKLH